MSITAELFADLERRMDGGLKSLQHEFSGLRTGRASVSLLDHVSVDAYGSAMPLAQVASINAPEARLLTVQVWDRGMVKAVEKAIIGSGLGLNPAVDGQLLRIPMPDLSQERRQELVKVASRYAEQAKVAIRNVRRDGMDRLKKMEKDGELSKDELKVQETELQKLTDTYVGKVDESFVAKEKDILQV